MYELFFLSLDMSGGFRNIKQRLSTFSSIEELEKYYMSFFDSDNPIEHWDVKDFDECRTRIEKEGGAVLATNEQAKMDFVLKRSINVEIATSDYSPHLLVVDYIQ